MRTEFSTPPSPTELANLISTAGLSKALSDVDKLVYATAVHSELGVVTKDRGLAKAIQLRELDVGNIALILQDLVLIKKLYPTAVERILQKLADRKDFLLGTANPTWADLKDYTFPD